jgi:hypothetical protein
MPKVGEKVYINPRAGHAVPEGSAIITDVTSFGNKVKYEDGNVAWAFGDELGQVGRHTVVSVEHPPLEAVREDYFRKTMPSAPSRSGPTSGYYPDTHAAIEARMQLVVLQKLLDQSKIFAERALAATQTGNLNEIDIMMGALHEMQSDVNNKFYDVEFAMSPLYGEIKAKQK